MRNTTASPLTFLDQLMKKWDIRPIDWNVTAEEGVRKLERDVGDSTLADEVKAAWAVALGKMRTKLESLHPSG